ncbi:LOW QUALITY PROTEIN: chalcone synthase-like [Oryza brachyantha]|uniref:LOW QUALITY PROTEIN: chalcone synthase-like n=1 Tax=Oryza brachyantha TaxID=4533 RepID=UPI001ADA14AB|nr:LOW QUALITY PROTEIN: chalcone synthase-like [Oryza brachyantha]
MGSLGNDDGVRRQYGQQAAAMAGSTAAVLAIGTANPSNVVEQRDFPDFYFRVTNSDHKQALKDKFTRICEKSTIKKRHLYIDEALLAANPKLTTYMAPTLDMRQAIVSEKIPELGAAAATAALKEWGRPAADITHLVVGSTSGGSDMPGADYHLVRLLGLNPSVRRVALYHQGCFVGAAALRLAKDLAENNPGARVLAVCAETNVMYFRGVDDAHFDNLVCQALFGDGASAVVVGAGADPVATGERPLFDVVHATQTLIPGTGGAIRGLLREVGLTFGLTSEVPSLIAEHLEAGLRDMLDSAGVDISDVDRNAMFWAVHPGGRAILDKVEAALGLKPEKTGASRKVLAEYGNMGSACAWFVLDEMRRWSAGEGRGTAGEGCEWGVLLGFGPGLTMDTVLLRSAHI